MLRRVFTDEEEKSVYRVFLGLFLVAALLFIALSASGFRPTESLPGCVVRRYAGFYCPGCGMSHAAEALLSFHPFRAFLYNPFFVYAAGFLTVYLLANALGWVFGRRSGEAFANRPFVLPIRGVYLLLGVLLLLGNWVLRNILWFLWGIPIY